MNPSTLSPTHPPNHQRRLKTIVQRLIIEGCLEHYLAEGLQDVNVQTAAAGLDTVLDRLRAAGRLMKVARCAAARKLLHIAWAVVKKGQPFDPNYGQEQQPA